MDPVKKYPFFILFYPFFILFFLACSVATLLLVTNKDSMLLDFSKAFDKVPHERLHKLSFCGVRVSTLALIRDFLRNRIQKVVMEGQTSNTAHMTSGVPQGSVIGPLLFLVYSNDLPDYNKHSSTSLFADGSMVGGTIRNQK